MPITRKELNPWVGWYGFLDDAYKKCSFGLLPSEDGVHGGAVETVNCEALLPRLASAKRWESTWLQFTLWAESGAVGACRATTEPLQLKMGVTRRSLTFYDIRRLDAPNRGLPRRLAVGWWTFSILGLPRGNDPRLLLTIDGRIGDVRCPPDHAHFGHLANFVGGRWRADEKGVTLYGHEEWRTLRYEGMGKRLVSGNYMMVHDD